MNRFYTE